MKGTQMKRKRHQPTKDQWRPEHLRIKRREYDARPSHECQFCGIHFKHSMGVQENRGNGVVWYCGAYCQRQARAYRNFMIVNHSEYAKEGEIAV